MKTTERVRMFRFRQRLKQANIHEVEYSEQFRKQREMCAICDADPFPLQLQLDLTEPGRLRGLLCTNCKAALALFGGQAETLARAAEYLAAQ